MKSGLLLPGFALLLTVRAVAGGVGPVAVSGTDADAFRLSWAAVDGAEGYVINVWSNATVGASEGVEVLDERFSAVPSRDYKSMWSINDVNALGDYRHWTGELIRGYPSKGEADSESAVVLGTADDPGWLLSAPLEASGEAFVRLRLTRHTDDDTAPALVAFVRDGATNFSASVVLGTAVHAFADYGVVATNLSGGCRLLVSSQRKRNGTKFGRVAVSAVSVRIGCSSGEAVRMPVVADARVGKCSYSLAGARPVRYGYSVAAHGGSADSTPVTGEVDMGDPPWLRCWRTSRFLPKPGFRSLDLSGMGKLASRRSWLNGEDGDGLYAFSDTGADVDYRPYSETAAYHALYSFNAGTEESRTNALALLVSSSSGLRVVLPIRLDAPRPLKKLSVSYVLRNLYRQGASRDAELSFSWLASDDFGAMEDGDADWTKVEGGGWVATVNGERSVSREVVLPVRSMREAKYLFLQWRVPRQASSAMVGLSDLAVEGSLAERGFKVLVK